MRFRTKLFLVYEAIFIIIFLFIGFVLTNVTYQNIRQSEFDGFVYEADNLLANMKLFMNNEVAEHKAPIDYANSMVDLFSKADVYVEIYDANLSHLAGNGLVASDVERTELTAALENKGEATFISRHSHDGRYWAYYSQFLPNEDGGVLVALIKDISSLEERQKELHFIILKALFIGFVVVGILIALASSVLMYPIAKIASTVRAIASGDYHQRVPIQRKDEFGDLAAGVNAMALAIEHNIQVLESQNEAQEQLLANLTHELRTPLTSIIGYADLLQSQPYDKKLFEKGLGYIASEGKRILNLNKNLMNLIYFEHHDLHFVEYHADDLMHQIQDLLHFSAEQKEIDLYSECKPFVFRGDIEFLKALLMNLIDNAIKATPHHGHIVISASCDEKNAIFSILDTGKGIQAEELEKIMAPFYRVDKARSREEGGLGLGLAIVKRIAELHKGKIYFESTLEKGTTVDFIMPLHLEKN